MNLEANRQEREAIMNASREAAQIFISYCRAVKKLLAEEESQ